MRQDLAASMRQRSTRMGAAVRAALCASLLLATSACGTNLSHYGQSRALDLMDVIPISFAGGIGLLAQARVTPLCGIGIGYANTIRVGSDDQRYGPLWHEKERGIPIFRYYRIEAYEDFEVRWPGGDPLWWYEDRRARAVSYLFLPGYIRDGDFLTPLPSPLDPAETDLWTFRSWLAGWPPYVIRVPWNWPPYSRWNMLNVEAGVVAGPVGVRLGVCPLQVFDFVLGLFRVDLACDDVRIFPVLWPDPDAEPSFPERVEPPEGDVAHETR